MPTRPDHATAERRFRALLADQGLPQPDEVAHWRDALVFGWRDTKAIVVVDLDEVDELDGSDPSACFGVCGPAPDFAIGDDGAWCSGVDGPLPDVDAPHGGEVLN